MLQRERMIGVLLPDLLSGYRSVPPESTGFAPFYLGDADRPGQVNRSIHLCVNTKQMLCELIHSNVHLVQRECECYCLHVSITCCLLSITLCIPLHLINPTSQACVSTEMPMYLTGELHEN